MELVSSAPAAKVVVVAMLGRPLVTIAWGILRLRVEEAASSYGVAI
jgi:hypothetical protein